METLGLALQLTLVSSNIKTHSIHFDDICSKIDLTLAEQCRFDNDSEDSIDKLQHSAATCMDFHEKTDEWE